MVCIALFDLTFSHDNQGILRDPHNNLEAIRPNFELRDIRAGNDPAFRGMDHHDCNSDTDLCGVGPILAFLHFYLSSGRSESGGSKC